MDARENDGRNVPKLARVQRGEPITADAWNQIVDAINRPVDVSIRRPRRSKGGGASGTVERLTVVTSVSVNSGGSLVFSTATKKFLIEE